MKKTKITAWAFTLATLMQASLGAAAAMPQYHIDYIKGNVLQKCSALEEAAAAKDNALCLDALDFALSLPKELLQDADITTLVKTAVQSLSFVSHDSDQAREDISARLAALFQAYTNTDVRLAVLSKLADFPSDAAVSLLNSYLMEQVQAASQKSAGNTIQMDAVLQHAISVLGTVGNNTSFNLLFVADLLDIWPEYKGELRKAYSPLANSNEKEILSILSNVSIEKKLEILEITSKNNQISQKICGEVAENALSEAIYTVGEMTDVSKEQLELQMVSLQTIADMRWTRASKMATDYFKIARTEYENDLLNSEQFSQIITNVATVASSETGQILSRYLDFLNKSMEQNNAPVEAVVLSVINALGGLGDKTAFDYLLYVTYLDYSEPVVLAARSALANLKW